MFFRARRALQRAWFDLNCRAVLKTAPLVGSGPGVTLVSMLPHGEVTMYLVAAKSFCRQLGRVPAVVILNDGSLTERDQATLRAHVPAVRIVSIAEISTGSCPKGSCWERLMLIADLVGDTYVVQLDSDTLTLGPVPEVMRAIAENESFTLLGDRSFPEIEPMLEACERAKPNLHPQVQAVCERRFDELPEASSLKYLRGNAGFTGFARGAIGRDRVGYFSELMRRLAGKQWDEWGSEQLTSNLLIANAERAMPLPFPKYLSYWDHPEVAYDKASFVHFIGPHRYSHGFYLKSAKRAIRELPRG